MCVFVRARACSGQSQLVQPAHCLFSQANGSGASLGLLSDRQRWGTFMQNILHSEKGLFLPGIQELVQMLVVLINLGAEMGLESGPSTQRES